MRSLGVCKLWTPGPGPANLLIATPIEDRVEFIYSSSQITAVIPARPLAAIGRFGG